VKRKWKWRPIGRLRRSGRDAVYRARKRGCKYLACVLTSKLKASLPSEHPHRGIGEFVLRSGGKAAWSKNMRHGALKPDI